jgi:ComF family protein
MTNDNVLQLIHLLKFSRYRALAGPIARAIGSAVRSLAPTLRDASVIVPTPMARRDLRRRGFNQAQEIALALANDLGLPILNGVLHKTASTAPQSRTKHENRARNVRRAFACSSAGVRDRHVLLVDDLVTTGATAAACAAAVFAAGACRVTVLCFGRAV